MGIPESAAGEFDARAFGAREAYRLLQDKGSDEDRQMEKNQSLTLQLKKLLLQPPSRNPYESATTARYNAHQWRSQGGEGTLS